MSDEYSPVLMDAAARGDRDALDQLVEKAAYRADVSQLRLLVEWGSKDALDELVQSAGELGDRHELRRLASGGSKDARDLLAEMDESDTP
jgi:hypothetical protein